MDMQAEIANQHLRRIGQLLADSRNQRIDGTGRQPRARSNHATYLALVQEAIAYEQKRLRRELTDTEKAQTEYDIQMCLIRLRLQDFGV